MQLVNIGFGNIVSAERIISIVSPESAPIKRIVQEAKDSKMAIDATYGRRTRSVIIMDSGHIILSSVQPETVAGRIDKDIMKNAKRIEREYEFVFDGTLSSVWKVDKKYPVTVNIYSNGTFDSYE